MPDIEADKMNAGFTPLGVTEAIRHGVGEIQTGVGDVREIV